MVGRALIRAIVDQGDEAALEGLWREYFRPDEYPYLDLLLEHHERHGRLPSAKIFEQHQIPLPDAQGSVSYHLSALRSRAMEDIINSRNRDLQAALTASAPERVARVVEEIHERLQRVNIDATDRYRIQTLSDLMTNPPSSPRWVIPGVVPEGLTLLAGKPEVGKSYLVLDWCLAVASGSDTMGLAECDPSDVLYISLEGGESMLHERARQLGAHRTLSSFEFATDFPPLEAGGLARLRDWFRQKSGQSMVVIDTLARVRRPNRASSYWNDVNELTPLHDLAHEHRSAIVLVHHCKKGGAVDPLDEISGSVGLSATADTLVVLRRDTRDSDLVYMHVRGRLAEQRNIALRRARETQRFIAVGEAEDFQRADSQRRALEYLNSVAQEPNPIRTPSQIAQETGLQLNTVNQALLRLSRDNRIGHPSRGRYHSINARGRLGMELWYDD